MSTVIQKPFEEASYRKYIERTTTLRDRSLGDAVSRTRRVLTMVNIGEVRSMDQLDTILLSNQKIRLQSDTVRSQLKRAARLYFAFLSNRNA